MSGEALDWLTGVPPYQRERALDALVDLAAEQVDRGGAIADDLDERADEAGYTDPQVGVHGDREYARALSALANHLRDRA